MVIPYASDLRSKLISLRHDTPFAGQFMKEKTVHLIWQSYWWPGMTKDVHSLVQTCDFCQRHHL